MNESKIIKMVIKQCEQAARKKAISLMLDADDRDFIQRQNDYKISKEYINKIELTKPKTQQYHAPRHYVPSFVHDPRYAQVHNYPNSPAWWYSKTGRF